MKKETISFAEKLYEIGYCLENDKRDDVIEFILSFKLSPYKSCLIYNSLKTLYKIYKLKIYNQYGRL